MRGVADAFPAVTTFIVGNEPNLNTFWRPQGDGTGRMLSGAASSGRSWRPAYDALKAKSTGDHRARRRLSRRAATTRRGAPARRSPVHFLDSLGDWYRASGRPVPLMDGFSYHPYPNPSDFSVPFTFTYGWPNAGIAGADRIKQAIWDAFDGTAQPTTVATACKLYLDEVGWQVDTIGHGRATTGSENVASRPRRRRPRSTPSSSATSSATRTSPR